MAPPVELDLLQKVGKWVDDLFAGRAFFVWYVAPFAFVLLYFLTSAGWSARGARRRTELERWLGDFLGPLKREPREERADELSARQRAYRSTARPRLRYDEHDRKVDALPEIFAARLQNLGSRPRVSKAATGLLYGFGAVSVLFAFAAMILRGTTPEAGSALAMMRDVAVHSGLGWQELVRGVVMLALGFFTTIPAPGLPLLGALALVVGDVVVTFWVDSVGFAALRIGMRGALVTGILYALVAPRLRADARVVLQPKHAFLTLVSADAGTSSDHQSVLLRLSKPAPLVMIQPVPIVDGKARPPLGDGMSWIKALGSGVQAPIVRFTGKDEALFNDRYFVQGTNRAAVEDWLTPELRDALCDLPGLWLHAEGKVLSLTLFGEADAEKLDELVGVADAFAAEYGAADESLFGPEEHVAPEKAPVPELPPADVQRRVLAAAIDYGLYVVGAALVAATIYFGSDVKERSMAFDHVLGAPPADDGSGPWNGGWTPGGFGWFFLAEAILVGLYVAQAYLATSRGKSIGKLALGLRVVRPDGARLGFVRGVLLRSWLWWLVPIAGAAAFFAYRASGGMPKLGQLWPVISGSPVIFIIAAVVVLADTLASTVIADGRCLHDLLAGTRVVFESRREPATASGPSLFAAPTEVASSDVPAFAGGERPKLKIKRAGERSTSSSAGATKSGSASPAKSGSGPKPSGVKKGSPSKPG